MVVIVNILHVQATSWKLEEAIQLFYIGNDGGAAASFNSPQLGNDALPSDPSLRYFRYRYPMIFLFSYSFSSFHLLFVFLQFFPCLWSSGAVKESEDNNLVQDDGDDVRPPLPVKREALYDNAVLYGYAVQLLMLLNLLWLSICESLFFFLKKLLLFYWTLAIILSHRNYCFEFHVLETMKNGWLYEAVNTSSGENVYPHCRSKISLLILGNWSIFVYFYDFFFIL